MNLSFANKNPFSTFDFLGYFFPGALSVGLFYIFTDGIMFDEKSSENIPHAIFFLKTFIKTNFGVGLFLLILFSYIIGHLLSYASSITVELFYTWHYGYPTRYLLRKENEEQVRGYLLDSNLKFAGMLGHLLVCMLLSPIVAGHFFFERLLNMESFIGRNLDNKLIDSIRSKIKQICDIIGYKDAKSSDPDVHRVVMHYVFEHCQMHQVKFDNYVALYGLLRSSTFVFCLFTIYQFVHIFSNHSIPHKSILWFITIVFLAIISCLIVAEVIIFLLTSKKHNITLLETTNWLLCLIIVVISCYVVTFILMIPDYTQKKGDIILFAGLFFLTYLSYLGFAKFYRRFSLENYMALLVSYVPKEEKDKIRISTESPINITIDRPTSLMAELLRAYMGKLKNNKQTK